MDEEGSKIYDDKWKDFDWEDAHNAMIDFLLKYMWMGVASGVEGLCIECYQSKEQGHAADCQLYNFLKRIEEVE